MQIAWYALRFYPPGDFDSFHTGEEIVTSAILKTMAWAGPHNKKHSDQGFFEMVWISNRFFRSSEERAVDKF